MTIQQTPPEHVMAAVRFLADSHQAYGLADRRAWVECQCGERTPNMAAHRADVVARYVWLAAQVAKRGPWYRRLAVWWARQRTERRRVRESMVRGGWGRA